MSTEIEQIEDLIINAVKAGIPSLRIVEPWPDGSDLDGLLETMLDTPALYVIYGGRTHGERKIIGGNTNDTDMTFRLTLIMQNLRSVKDGSRGAYQYIEDLTALFKGYNLSPLVGYLWPVSDELIAVKDDKFAYGLEFIRRTNR